jgi:2-polyprenyl-3-methyl-5-hydroxy-6-metoxy-1,4-benzoquinol methylase
MPLVFTHPEITILPQRNDRMRIGDYLIQIWRMQVAARWIPRGSRVLDIGCHQGEFFLWLGDKIIPSIGLDPLYKEKNTGAKTHRFLNQTIRENLPFQEKSFDAVVLLATIEHIQDKSVIAREAARLLRKGGRVIITVPSLMVDRILQVLLLFRIVDGMSLEEHHGFQPNELPDIFVPEGFSIRKKQKFQFGLNNLYVFERN